MSSTQDQSSSPTDKVLIPSKLEQVTPSWLSSVLSKKINDENFVVIGNVHDGTGFLSQMFRINCTYEDGNKNQELNLIVKLLPDGVSSKLSAISRELCINERFFDREIIFYKTVVPDLTEQLPELSKYICPFYFGLLNDNNEEDPGSLIIMKDLKPYGYKTITFDGEITWEQLEEGVKFLAKFHFASYAVQWKKLKDGQSLHSLYPILGPELNDTHCDEEMEKSAFYVFCIEGLSKLDAFFKTQNCDESFRAYFNQVIAENKQSSMVKKIFLAQKNKYQTLQHGDLWSNNILLNDDTENYPIIAIDWQLLSVGDPTYDLCILIISSLTVSSLTKENVDKLVKLYYDTFTQYCKANNCEKFYQRTFDEFSKFFYTFAMGYTFLWFDFSPYPFAGNYPKLVNIYEFFRKVKIVEFLLTLE